MEFTLKIYQKFIKVATKYAQFAAHAAPFIEREVNFISAAVSATRKIAVVHCVTVLFIGCPSEVRQAEDVCTSDSVTAFTAIILISVIKICCSAGASEPKISFVASGANANSPTAAGTDTARVISSDLNAFFLAAAKSPLSASGEICGTLEAASPYVTETGRLIIVTAHPENTP